MDRRSFVKKTAIGSAAILGTSYVSTSNNLFYTGEIPTIKLGKTGVEIPRIALGCGSRFCNIESEDVAIKVLEYALDNGLCYWDTAPVYMNKALNFTSEERLGKVLKTRRDEVFLSTKISNRDPDIAMRTLEKSLDDLQTDHVDILLIHDVKSKEDVENLRQKGNLVDLALKMKKEKVTKFIGFSGHKEEEALAMMADTGLFDSCLIALNQWGSNKHNRQNMINNAGNHHMGVMVMKAIRSVEKNNKFTPEEMLTYALSLEGVHGLVLGMDSYEIVKSNIIFLKEFKPYNKLKINKMTAELHDLYNNPKVKMPWMKRNYQDGIKLA
jgi:uncharacterized protein